MGIAFLLAYGGTLGFIAALLGNAKGFRSNAAHITLGMVAALFSGLALPLALGLAGMADDGRIDVASLATACLGTICLVVISTFALHRR